MKRSISITAAVALAVPTLFVGVPAATAADESSSANYIVSARSFPKVNTAKTDFFAEATSTDVEDDSNWGGLGTMDVPETKSQAEKDAEKKAQEEAAQKAAEEAARVQREQEEAAAASRAQEREDLTQQTETATQDTNTESTQSSESTESAQSTQESTQSLPSVPASKNGSAIASYAQQFKGAPYVFGGTTPSGWDCSGFVQWVYAQFGISLPRTSGAQATVGVAVPSLAEAQPGDIIANGMHAGIYIGNGMVMNALNPSQGTQATNMSVFSGGYSIRRVL